MAAAVGWEAAAVAVAARAVADRSRTIHMRYLLGPGYSTLPARWRSRTNRHTGRRRGCRSQYHSIVCHRYHSTPNHLCMCTAPKVVVRER